jgi:hypothetical protein
LAQQASNENPFVLLIASVETSNQQVFITRYAYRLAEILTIFADDDPRAYWNFY